MVAEVTLGRRAVSVGRVGSELALLKQTGKGLHLSRGVSDLIVTLLIIINSNCIWYPQFSM